MLGLSGRCLLHLCSMYSMFDFYDATIKLYIGLRLLKALKF
ncbi:hypothetical protein ALT785_830005 [Alteromonas infernus]